MSARLTRRGTLEFFAAGAFIGLVPVSASARAATPLSPPRTPMLFTRRLVREAPGGAAIDVRRGFEVRFTPLAEGYRIDGRQVSSDVAVPPALAPLGEIERNRVESGLFPFDLNRDGLVLDRAGAISQPTPELEKAIDAALRMLREHGENEATIRDASTFYRWLQQAAGTIGTMLPPDLFVPPAVVQKVARTIDLPGAGSGTIETSFSGKVSPETGLMREAERLIVTISEGTSLRTIESWTLAPI